MLFRSASIGIHEPAKEPVVASIVAQEIIEAMLHGLFRRSGPTEVFSKAVAEDLSRIDTGAARLDETGPVLRHPLVEAATL